MSSPNARELPRFPDGTMDCLDYWSCAEVGAWIAAMYRAGARLDYPDNGWTHPTADVAELNRAMWRFMRSSPGNEGFVYGFVAGLTEAD